MHPTCFRTTPWGSFSSRWSIRIDTIITINGLYYFSQSILEEEDRYQQNKLPDEWACICIFGRSEGSIEVFTWMNESWNSVWSTTSVLPGSWVICGMAMETNGFLCMNQTTPQTTNGADDVPHATLQKILAVENFFCSAIQFNALVLDKGENTKLHCSFVFISNL